MNDSQVRQPRVVVEAPDFDAAVRFYRDVLRLTEELAVAGPNGAQVVILDAGRATLELANPAQKRYIDEIEVGRPVAPRIRLAFEVADAAATADRLVAAGAELIAPPTETPWRSLNARLAAPADLRLTLFEELGGVTGSLNDTVALLERTRARSARAPWRPADASPGPPTCRSDSRS